MDFAGIGEGVKGFDLNEVVMEILRICFMGGDGRMEENWMD